jgi:hypothetical protein
MSHQQYETEDCGSREDPEGRRREHVFGHAEHVDQHERGDVDHGRSKRRREKPGS